MRILHLLEPTTAGVPRLVAHIATAQVKAGHAVHILSPRPLDVPSTVTQSHWTIQRRRPWTYLRACSDIRRVENRFSADVVHAHSFFAGLLARIPGYWRDVTPIVYQPHAWAFDIASGRLRWLVEAWERRAASRTTALVTNCTDELDRGRRARITTRGWPIGIAVDVDRLRPPSAAERKAAREELGLGPGPVVLLLGRIAPQKGQEQLVHQWRPEGLPTGSRLVLVGPGNTRRLERVASRHWGSSILYAGSQADVRPWLWAADLMVIPSRYETVSLVAGEAMSTALTVVATDFDGVAELLGVRSHDPAGVVVPLGDMAAIRQSVRDLLVDPALRTTYGLAGRRRAVRYCSPTSVERALGDVYAAITPAAKVP